MSTRTFATMLAASAALVLVGAGCGTAKKQVVPDGGVFKTVDGGETWRQQSVVPTASGVRSFVTANVLTMASDPHHAETVYAGTTGDGLFVTNNNGIEWRRAGGQELASVRAVAVDPVEPCTWYASAFTRVYKTRDCGRVWKSVYETAKPGQEVRAIAIAPDNHNRVYFVVNDQTAGMLIASGDGGATGSVAYRFGMIVREVAIDAKRPTRLYAVTENRGLWRSDDAGVTWRELRQELQAFAGAKRGWELVIDAKDNESFLYASSHGLLYSTDGGATWTAIPLLTAPGEARIYSVAVNPQNAAELYYSAVVGGKSLLYKSVDGGATWKTKKLPTGRIPNAIHIRADKPAEVLVGTYQKQQ